MKDSFEKSKSCDNKRKCMILCQSRGSSAGGAAGAAGAEGWSCRLSPLGGNTGLLLLKQSQFPQDIFFL